MRPAGLLAPWLRLSSLRQLVLASLVTVAAAVLVLSVVLSKVYYESTLTEVEGLSAAALGLAAAQFNDVNAQVLKTGNRLVSDPAVLSYGTGGVLDRVAEFQIAERLRGERGVYDYLASISLYCLSQGRLVSTSGSRSLGGEEAARLLDGLGPSPLSLRQGPAAGRPGQPPGEEVVTYLFKPQYQGPSSGPAAFLLSIDVPTRYFAELLAGLKIRPDEELEASGFDGVRIRSPGASSPLPALGPVTGDETGTQVLRTADRVVIRFLAPSSSWQFTCVLPLAGLLPSVNAVLAVTVALALGLVLLGAVVVLLFTRRLYAPVAEILRQHGPEDGGGLPFDEKVLIAGALRGARTECVRGWLLGAEPQDPVARQLLSTFRREFEGRAALVALLRAPGAAGPELLRAHLESPDAYDSVPLSETDTALVVWTPGEAREEEVAVLLGALHRRLVEAAGRPVALGLGPLLRSPEAFPEGLLRAQVACSAAFLGDGGGVFLANDPRLFRRSTRYPAELERRLIAAGNAGKPAEVEKAVRAVFGHLAKLSVPEARRSCVDLFSALHRWSGLQVPEASEIGSLDDAEREVLALFRQASERGGSGAGDRHRDLVARMQDLARSRFADPGLNLNQVAGLVGLSADYAGRLFRHEAGTSFSAYLADLRLDEARRRLAASDQSVAQIATAVGLANTTYLFTLFRRQYGQTPSQYREALRPEAAPPRSMP